MPTVAVTLGKMFLVALFGCTLTGSQKNGATPKLKSARCFLWHAGVLEGFTATAVSVSVLYSPVCELSRVINHKTEDFISIIKTGFIY